MQASCKRHPATIVARESKAGGVPPGRPGTGSYPRLEIVWKMAVIIR